MDHPLTQTWDLVRQAQDGDGDALDRLFGRYYERVRRSVRARLGARLRERLESGDIVQPALAKAFENFDRFEMRTEGSLLHWLAEYAERQLHDAADRHNAKKRRAPGGAELSLDAEHSDGKGGRYEATLPVAAGQTGPLDRAMRDEHQAAIEECIDELPRHYRLVIALRDYEGLEWRAVAAELGKNTESAARDQHQRALIELSRLLRARGVGPDE